MKKVLHILFSLTLAFLLLSCHKESDRIFKRSEFLMDTIVTVTVVSSSAEDADRAMNRVFQELKQMESLLNFFSTTSEISVINNAAGKHPVRVSDTTYNLLSLAREISEKTEGNFDITVGVISHLYDFLKKSHPSDSDINRLLPLVGYKKMELNSDKKDVFLQLKGMMIDPGGITKGYAADRAVEILKAEGIKAALVAVAGDIRGYGLKPDGKGWIVGIKDPRDSSEEGVFAILELRDMAISTSGDYQRFFIENGTLYHHIIDPKTGKPAKGLISVSVVGPKAAYTDALATALFVKGSVKGIKMVEALGYSAIIVDNKGEIHFSEHLKKMLKLLKHRISGSLED